MPTSRQNCDVGVIGRSRPARVGRPLDERHEALGLAAMIVQPRRSRVQRTTGWPAAASASSACDAGAGMGPRLTLTNTRSLPMLSEQSENEGSRELLTTQLRYSPVVEAFWKADAATVSVASMKSASQTVLRSVFGKAERPVSASDTRRMREPGKCSC